MPASIRFPWQALCSKLIFGTAVMYQKNLKNKRCSSFGLTGVAFAFVKRCLEAIATHAGVNNISLNRKVMFEKNSFASKYGNS
jgi:hypothetical protein